MTFKEMLDFKFQDKRIREMLEKIVILDIENNFQDENFGCEKCYEKIIAVREKRLRKKYEDFSKEQANEIEDICFYNFLNRMYEAEKEGQIIEKCDAWKRMLSKAEVERCEFLDNNDKCEICGKSVESLQFLRTKIITLF